MTERQRQKLLQALTISTELRTALEELTEEERQTKYGDSGLWLLSEKLTRLLNEVLSTS